MSFDRTPRTYTYRIPLDETHALRKIRRLQRVDSGYFISKLHKSEVPTAGNGRHFACVFYQSTEQRDYDSESLTGGSIPGLHEYRYSLEWKPFPNKSLLEMRNANGGGTRIKGEVHVGFSDPRVSDYVPINIVVGWTPTEVENIYAKSVDVVPDKENYSHDPPEITISEAKREIRDKIDIAKEEGITRLKKKLEELVENCPHKHVITHDSVYGEVAHCEDCGRGWEKDEFDAVQETVTTVKAN